MKTSLVVGLAVVVFFVATIVVMAYRSALEFRGTQRWVEHTHQVLDELGGVRARVHDAESTKRLFIITGRDADLKDYGPERDEIRKSLARLRELMKDNPAQAARLAQLDTLLDQRAERFDLVIRLRREQGLQAAADALPPGRALTEQTHALLAEMEVEERKLLAQRSGESDLSRDQTMAAFIALSVATSVVVAALLLLAQRGEAARARAEQGLRSSEERLQDLYDRAPCGYITADSRGILTRINATALGWLSYRREEVEGRMSAGVLLPPDLSGSFEQKLAAFRDQGVAIEGQEFSLRRKDGRAFPVLVSALTEKDASGAVVGTRLSIFDVTERKRIERELDQFFTTSLDLLGVADLSSGRFVRVSPSWVRTLGWSEDEITARPWTDFVHPDDLAETISKAKKLGEGQSVVSFENRYRCKDGSYRWLSWKVPAPLPGSPTLFCVARDVTDAKRQDAEILSLNAGLKARVDEALAANRELEAFSYSVSHDLRAPLRSIDGFSRILIEDHAANLGKEGARLLNLVCGSSRQMGQLIDDLLQYSRLGRKEIETTRIEMGPLVQDALEEVRKAQPERKPAVSIGPLPAVRGDRALLRQVWVNLVSNAFKYSAKSASPKIEIGSDGANGSRAFYVRDNGVGFDMAYAGKLFGVFQRLHSQSEFEGTGVGLAIVQRVVLRHGGKVWAEGKPGEGAVFHFTVPLQGEGT